MGANLTLFQKGLALVAIPLLFQLLFLGLYLKMRADSDAAQESAALSRQVNTEAEEVFRLLTDAQNSMRGYVLSEDATFLQPYEQNLPAVARKIEYLQGLVRDPEQRTRAEQIADKAARLIDFLREAVELMRAGNREGAVAGVKRRTGEERMEALRQEIQEFLKHQDRLDGERTEALERTWRQQNWLVGVMIAISVLLAVGTAFLFSQAVSARLGVLNDNARRLAAGEELTAPMQGGDEIALLDRTFHAMAETIRRRVAELGTAVESLRRSNQELEQFASVASHDLQEPLRKIQAFGDRLQSKCGTQLGDQGHDYLERILTSAARMRKLIDDLLTFSRVTSKAQPFVPTSLTALAREVVSDLEGRLEQTGGRVEVDELPTLDADPLQMRQLLQNLIANGLKFHRPEVPSLVRVRGRLFPAGAEGRNGDGQPESLCEIAVEDNGIGFEEIYLDRIFEVFQRLHGRNEYEGTGMGLAICRKIVERHGGHITARSTPGQGATFLVTLPVQRTPEENSR